MRPNQNNRRPRGRNNNNSGNNRRPNLPNRNQTFDSNGPDVRIRGTAFQVAEKYQNLARDAASAGDRVLAENYLQHAEHYQRIISAMNESVQQRENRQPQQRTDDQDNAPSDNSGPPPRRNKRDRDDTNQPSSPPQHAEGNGRDPSTAPFAGDARDQDEEDGSAGEGDLFAPPRPAPRRRGRRPQRPSGAEASNDGGETSAESGNGHAEGQNGVGASPEAHGDASDGDTPRPRRRRAPRKTDDEAAPTTDR